MRETEIDIKAKNYTLRRTLVVPNNTNQKLPAVVFYHGMVSQRKPRYVKRAQALAKEGVVGLCFDFRGCGESDGQLGEITIADWFDDALLTFDFLAKQDFVDSSRIGMGGKSFGGYMGALVSEKGGVRSIVLQAPAVYADSWFNNPYKPSTWHDDKFTKMRNAYRNSKDVLTNKAIEAIKRFRNFLLVIGSEFDDICPRRIVEVFYNASPSKNKKLIWIKSADHALRNEKCNEEYTQLMVAWFKRTL